MKPFIIESFGNGPTPLSSWQLPPSFTSASDDFTLLGDISTLSVSPSEWDFPALIARLKETCFCPTKRRHYSPFDFTVVNQSVGMHVDDGCGPLVATLVWASGGSDLERRIVHNRFELITKHGPLPLRLGDMFIFNANLPHAWIAYEACALACMTVKRCRT